MKKAKYEHHRSSISMDGEIKALQEVFAGVEDNRGSNSSHKLHDIIMCGFAMFSLKYSSLLDFNSPSEIEKENLKKIYGIDSVCSDTQLRRVLDTIDPGFLRDLFPKQFVTLQKTGLLEEFGYKIGSLTYHIVSCDGVQHFSSKRISCDCCLKKEHRDGSISYHHNMLAAVLVHPEKREVFILDIEPITRQDGSAKNDCERNAAKRLQQNMAKNYEKHQKDCNFLLTEDALYANAPHIADLMASKFDYILNVKPDSHKTHFSYIEGKRKRKELKTHTFIEGGITHSFEYVNNALLCASSPNLRVNFIQYTQIDKKGKKTTFTWISNIVINKNKLMPLMRAARARWKIENETFNTLKNLGYHFEHNYGHGKDHLSTMFAYLMLYAFYLDQLIQACSRTFSKIEKKIVTKIKLWGYLKAIFQTTYCSSIENIYKIIASMFCVQLE